MLFDLEPSGALSLPPDPAKGIGEKHAAFLDAVAAFGGDELVIVFCEGEGFGHLLVGEPPVAVGIVEILSAVLKPNAQRAFVLLANEGGVNVSAADVGEAADVADDLAEEVGSLPRDGEGANSAGAGSTNDTLLRVLGQVVGLAYFGKEFGFEHAGVSVAEGVVFHAAIAFSPFLAGAPILSTFDFIHEDTGIDEDPDGDGNVSLMNEVIEGESGAALSFLIDVSMAILKNHHRGGLGWVVLGGDIEVILAQGAFEDLAAMLVAGDFAHGNALLTLRILGEGEFSEKWREGSKRERQNEEFHVPKVTWEDHLIYRG